MESQEGTLQNAFARKQDKQSLDWDGIGWLLAGWNAKCMIPFAVAVVDVVSIHCSKIQVDYLLDVCQKERHA